MIIRLVHGLFFLPFALLLDKIIQNIKRFPMARSVNKVILIGNLGQDPEVRYSPSGAAVCSVSLATTESWKDRDSGDRQEKTEWHRLVFFARLAEIVGEYLTKGSQIYAEGRLQTRKWQDQSGQDRYTTEIVVSDMRMLGGGKGGSSFTQYDDNKSGEAPAESSAKPAKSGDTSVKPPDFDDEIPF